MSPGFETKMEAVLEACRLTTETREYHKIFPCTTCVRWHVSVPELQEKVLASCEPSMERRLASAEAFTLWFKGRRGRDHH